MEDFEQDVHRLLKTSFRAAAGASKASDVANKIHTLHLVAL